LRAALHFVSQAISSFFYRDWNRLKTAVFHRPHVGGHLIYFLKKRSNQAQQPLIPKALHVTRRHQSRAGVWPADSGGILPPVVHF